MLKCINTAGKQMTITHIKRMMILIAATILINHPSLLPSESAFAGEIESAGLVINYDHSSFTSGSSTLTNLVSGETNATLRGTSGSLNSPSSIGQSNTRNFYSTTAGLGDNFASSRYIYTNTGMTSSKFVGSSVSAFAWVYPTTANHVVLEERGSSWEATRNWFDTQIEMVNQQYSFRVWNCSVITAPNVSALNAWHYVGFTYDDASDTMKAYVDGVQVSSNLACVRELPWTGSDRLLYYGVATNAGTDMNSGSNNYGGFDFGALHIYNRSITPTEVGSNYTTKLSQSITFSSLGTSSKSFPYSQSLSMVTSGTSGSGAITFSVTGGTASGCTLSNSSSTATISASSSGTCLVTASIASDSFFDSALSSSLSFTFSKASQALTFTTTNYSKTFAETQSVTATSAGSATITYSVGVSTACTVSGSTVTITAPTGTCIVTASRAEDDNYFAANSTNSVTIAVSKAVQALLTLTSTTTPFLTDLRLTSTGGSDTGTVSFTVSSAGTAGCSIVNSDSLTSSSVGSCQVVATKLGTANYLTAYDTRTITVSKATLVLSTSAVPTLKYGSSAAASYSANRSVGVGGIPAISGTVTYETSTSTACNINSATGLVTMNRASGTCSIRIRLSNDTNFQDTSSALVSITPAKADAITVTAADKNSVFTGTASNITPTYSVSGLQFSDTVTVTYGYMGLSNDGNLYSFVSDKPSLAGSYSIIPMVSQTNSDSYTSSATINSGILTISRAPRTLSPSTYSKLTLKYGESATVTSNTTSPSSNDDGAFSYSVGSGCAIDPGSGTVTAANYQGTCSSTTTILQSNNYESATASAVSFSLSKADTITVTASSPSAVTYTGSAAAVTPTVSVSGLVAGNSATGVTLNYSRVTPTVYGPSTTAPSNAGSYTITPSALILSGGITTDYYIATIYETGTLSISKANQNAFTSYQTLYGIFGTPFTIYKFGGSGTGEETLTVVNGTASGCALNGIFLTATTAGTCVITATKATSENHLETSSSFSVNLFYYVPAPVPPVSATPVQIAIEVKNNWSVNASVGPTITGTSPSSGPVGTVVTITGTGMNGVDVIKIGRRNLTSITGVSETSVTGVIPAGASSGPIFVSNSLGSHFFPSGFTVIAP